MIIFSKTKILQNVLAKIIILMTVVLFLSNLWQLRYSYTKPFDIRLHQFQFGYSQYNKDPYKQLFFIEDWELYSLAGYNYLKNGRLDEINPEHPPLGKYLFGLSILLFKNSNILQPLFALAILVMFFIIGKIFLKNYLLSSFIIFIFSLEGLFKMQLSLSLLDLTHLLFLLILTLGILKNKRMLTGLALGAFAATKAPLPAFIASLALLMHLLINKGKERGLFDWIEINLVSILIFFLNYFPFVLKNGVNNFIQLVIKAVKIHLSHVPEYPVGPVYGLIFTNHWQTWWDSKNLFWSISEWNLAWLILGIFFLISPYFFWRYFNKLKSFAFIYLFSWFYFVFIATRLLFPGYLLLILPFLYLISLRSTSLLINISGSKRIVGKNLRIKGR